MKQFKEEVSLLLEKHVGEMMDLQEIRESVEVPKYAEKGDVAFPCFKLAKSMRKNPAMIAKELSETITDDRFDIVAENAYLNFFVKKERLAEIVVGSILEEGEAYGATNVGENKTMIVEYSSANISKELHFGHIRGIMIGSSLYKLAKFLGYNAVAVNHLGDYGINFGKIITAYKHWGDDKDIEERGVRALLDLYVKFEKFSKRDEKFMEEARQWFHKLEVEKDQEAYDLWSWFKEISLAEYNRVYDMLGATFDSYDGEAFYSDKMPAVHKELVEKDLLFYEDGMELIDMSDYNLTNVIVTTSAGTSLYITRDIACAIYRKNHYDFYKNLYVVGSEQRLHFQQLRAILHKMGRQWWDDCVHVDHGLIMLKDGKLSSREGGVIFLEDVIQMAVQKTLELIDQKNPGLEDKEEVARQVGLGAIAYKELSTSRIKDYIFDWDEALSFEGETGPYLQYANVRAHSLLERGEADLKDIDYSHLTEEASSLLIRELSSFDEVLETALEKHEPAILSRYLMGVAKLFNRFYQQVSVITEDEEATRAKLALVKAVSQVLENGMKLINMEAPKKM
ncbi:MAG: arginine--tRNA ligase [Tissierellia bacterium]|nr:arginine--tRNA ligase [Bacillota bacterium]NLL22517.1 arginine--tRNA ligase [Tissierellia bacterium]